MDPATEKLIADKIAQGVADATAPLKAQVQALQQALEPIKQDQERISQQFGGASTASILGGLHRAVTTPGAQLMQPLDPVSIQLIKGVVTYTCHVLLKSTDAQTAANYTHFFVADRSYSVVAITEVHSTAGTDAGTVTLQVEKLSGTTAPGSGKNMLATAFNLKGTANTPQYATLITAAGSGSGGSTTSGTPTNIAKGDRIAWKTSGTLTSLQNVLVTILLQPI